jgi:hypothetical protein
MYPFSAFIKKGKNGYMIFPFALSFRDLDEKTMLTIPYGLGMPFGFLVHPAGPRASYKTAGGPARVSAKKD